MSVYYLVGPLVAENKPDLIFPSLLLGIIIFIKCYIMYDGIIGINAIGHFGIEVFR